VLITPGSLVRSQYGASLLTRSHLFSLLTRFMNLSHRIHICQLYKRALRCSLDWLIDRREWRRQAVAIRHQFDLHSKETDPVKIQDLVQATERLLWIQRHPEPYKCNLNPSSSSPRSNFPWWCQRGQRLQGNTRHD
jgi:NADH dehydrogenase (ubiquinone) 1 beta subcomplex subunit 9